MKKVLGAVFAAVIVLTSYVFAAELTMTDFSVSGNTVSVKGIISGAENSRASIYVTQGGSAVYIGQAEAEQGGSFDLSFTVPAEWKSGSYVANIGATECAAQTVSFTYPKDKAYIAYTPEEEEDTESDSIEVDSVKQISRVTVSGTVKERLTDDNKVMLVIKKEGTALNERNVAYIDQTSLSEEGTFSFNFNYVGDLSGYTAYLYADGRNISDSIEVAHTDYELITAEVEVAHILNKAKLMAKLSNNSEADVPYVMIITMYDENNVMVGMKAEEAMLSGQTSAQDTIELIIPQETVKIKAMLWNTKEEMLPIAKPSVINH